MEINNAKLKRNLLFCLITSIECDLRFHVLEINNSNPKIPKEIIEKANERYYNDNKLKSEDINKIVDYFDLGDCVQIINANKNTYNNEKLIREILESIEKIIPVRNRVMHSRPLNFDDDEIVLNFTDEIKKYNKVINFKETIKELNIIDSNPNYLVSVKISSKEEKNSIHHNLPMADYDDTGFIGRRKDKELLRDKLIGPYPVISIIGVGGYGKTSLALSCLYDLIEEYKDNDNPIFDTIMWVTLKTKSLQDGDFKYIRNSINTLNVAIMKSNEQLDLDSNLSNIDNILYYMRNHKTLLVIDNLETIDISENKKLFEELPTGSKILITSRIGIGDYEQIFKLNELTDKDAELYLRKLANIYKVDSLLRKKADIIVEYTKKLHKNPLAIKWFVINVGKGLEPDIIFKRKQDELIEFCLSNVYEKLSNNAKYILKIILLKHNRCNLAELVYISEKSYEECETAIYELLKSNFLEQNEDFSYSIPAFTTNYIKDQKFYMDNYNTIRQNIKKLIGNLENLDKDKHLTNEYHPISFFPKTVSEKIATVYMLKAVEASKNKDSKEMDKYYELAIQAAPKFSDIYKTSAYLYSKINVINAERDYENALELADNKAPIYYFYGGFLINNQNYIEGEKQILKSLELEPDNLLIRMRLARVYKMTNRYEKSIKLLNELETMIDKIEDYRMKIKLVYETIDTYARYADNYMINEDYENALIQLKNAISFIDKTDKKLFDFTIYNVLFKLAYKYIIVLSKSKINVDGFISYLFTYYKYIIAAKLGNKKEERFDYELNLLKSKLDRTNAMKIENILKYDSTIKEKQEGYISKLINGYGFIKPTSYSYQTLFFHSNQYKGDFRSLREGDKVNFEIQYKNGKLSAIEVAPIQDEEPISLDDL